MNGLAIGFDFEPRLELLAMAALVGAVPLVLLQTEPDRMTPSGGGAPAAPAAEGADGLHRHWPPPAVDVHKHYGYAFQWFALAALILGLYVWFQVLAPFRAGRAARADKVSDEQRDA